MACCEVSLLFVSYLFGDIVFLLCFDFAVCVGVFCVVYCFVCFVLVALVVFVFLLVLCICLFVVRCLFCFLGVFWVLFVLVYMDVSSVGLLCLVLVLDTGLWFV